MKISSYAVVKSGVSTFGLLFQLALYEFYGAELAGEVNRLHLWALFLSMLIFPGFELSLLRRLPHLRATNPTGFTATIERAKWLLSLCVSIALFILLLNAFLSSELFLLPAMAVLFFFVRILPVFFRVQRKLFTSVLSEQGVIFAIGSFVIAVSNLYLQSPITLWAAVCFLSLCLLLLICLFAWREYRTTSIFRKPDAIEDLREDYGVSVVLVAVSNFSMLWVPATVGTIVLSTSDIAASVSMLRIIGLLLFVETVMAGYHLPLLSSSLKSGNFQNSFKLFRRQLFFGTVIISLLTTLLLVIVKPFGFGNVEVVVFSGIAVVQLIVCALGSPFSIATVACEKSMLTKGSMIVLGLSSISVIGIIILPFWQTIVIGFAIVQFLKALVGMVMMRMEGIN